MPKIQFTAVSLGIVAIAALGTGYITGAKTVKPKVITQTIPIIVTVTTVPTASVSATPTIYRYPLRTVSPKAR